MRKSPRGLRENSSPEPVSEERANRRLGEKL
jgi:hypothetical protein